MPAFVQKQACRCHKENHKYPNNRSRIFDNDNSEILQQFLVKDFEIINGRYGAMACHKYDRGSIRVSCSLYVEIMAVDRYQFSVTV